MTLPWQRVVWDIFPQDFHAKGKLYKLLADVQAIDYDSLIALELSHVQTFLQEWERQLQAQKKLNAGSSEGDIDLKHLFCLTPKLSGVVYLSHNHVFSESLFDKQPTTSLKHPTDRLVHPLIYKQLPACKDLTFSFPRQYKFEGFYNSWGFVRIQTKDSKGSDAGVLLSVTTLDAQVMAILQKYHFESIVDLYNQAWDGAIHDYIHHIALYTNPSFGIGKLSPMALSGVQKAIDQWGLDMQDTFNYEYWAHLTHRHITKKTLTPKDKEQITFKAKVYFKAVKKLLHFLREEDPSFLQRLSNYLVSIYLWPMHILMHPLDPLFDALEEDVNALHIDKHKDLKEYALDILKSIESQALSKDPRGMALMGVQEGLKLKEKIAHPKEKPSWFDVMRMQTDSIVQRGMYEGWFHTHQVIYQKKPISAHQAMLYFLKSLQKTLHLFETKEAVMPSYTLQGIVA